MEVNFDVQRNINWHAIAHARSEAPLFEGLNGILIEAKTYTAHDALDIDSAVFANDNSKHDCSLIAGFAGFLGIFWLDSLEDDRRLGGVALLQIGRAHV